MAAQSLDGEVLVGSPARPEVIDEREDCLASTDRLQPGQRLLGQFALDAVDGLAILRRKTLTGDPQRCGPRWLDFGSEFPNGIDDEGAVVPDLTQIGGIGPTLPAERSDLGPVEAGHLLGEVTSGQVRRGATVSVAAKCAEVE